MRISRILFVYQQVTSIDVEQKRDKRIDEIHHLDLSKCSIISHRSRVDHQKPSEYFLDHQSSIENYLSTSISSKSLQLKTKPSDMLIFPLSSSSSPISLKLFNENSCSILFKFKTNEPEILLAQPARGFIPSNSSLQCYLTPIERNQIDENEEIFLIIQFGRIRNDFDDYQTQWNRFKSNEIFIKRSRCLFIKESHRTSLVKPMMLTLITLTLLTSWFIFKR